jgi:hypothetical protein
MNGDFKKTKWTELDDGAAEYISWIYELMGMPVESPIDTQAAGIKTLRKKLFSKFAERNLGKKSGPKASMGMFTKYVNEGGEPTEPADEAEEPKDKEDE